MREWTRNRLRVIRAEQRVTQFTMAQRLGVSQTQYWQIEHAIREPDAAMQRRIAKALGVPVPALVGTKAP